MAKYNPHKNIPAKEVLEELYINQNKSMTEIGKILGHTQDTISRYLKFYGIKIKSHQYKYSRNENYFSEPNIENCYWAGFIAADGCIFSSCLRINLHIKDKSHLEVLKNSIEYTGPLIDIIGKPSCTYHKKEAYYSSLLSIRSNKICDDLNKNFNITPRKSLTLQPPNLIDREHILSYIIGIIDGDGCLYFDKKRNGFSLQITGSSLIINWINNQFNNLGKISNHRISEGVQTVMYSIVACRCVLSQLQNHILKHKIPVLDRKWDKIEEFNLSNKDKEYLQIKEKYMKFIVYKSASEYYFTETLQEALKLSKKHKAPLYEMIKLNVISTENKAFEEIGE